MLEHLHYCLNEFVYQTYYLCFFFFSTISFFYASWSWCFYFFQLHAIFHFCVSPPPPLRVERVLFYTLNVWLGWNFKIGTKVKKETFFNSQTKKTYIFELQLMQKLQNLCILLFAKESVSAIFFPFIILLFYLFIFLPQVQNTQKYPLFYLASFL